jgi:alkanesulfonate monooxygenase SsuD/methylene tetrahydromethanopterin reductase-like flavin-dependent oxidoreductase (luciferase family)
MMHLGLVMECDYREGATQEEAFEEAFQMADAAEELGLDGIWLAERHFAARGGPLDTYGTGIPSIVSAPLIIATAIAARTQRLRVGIAVNVLPLCHPIRIAEEAATVDQISKGRLDFGVGRSGFPRAYEGYGIPYGESRERFQEGLDVILSAWTKERFSYTGKYYSFHELCVVPKPYQKPHPPIRVAATTRETFPQVGRMGHPIFIGLRGFDVSEAAHHLKAYRQAWRVERAQRLSSVSYDDLLRGRVAYGTPEMVAERLRELQGTLGLSGIILEPNVGGYIPRQLVFRSVRLFAEEVAPRLR